MKKIRLAAACILLLSAMVLQGCSGNDHGLDPDKPITLTLWHYYSGSQKQAFDELVDEFNETQGKKQGISVDAVAKGSISNISADLKSSLEKKVNAPELPNIFAAYGDTAEDMEKAEKLVSINDYMSDEEMAEYVDDYMKDGSLHDHAYVNIFPIAKATEVMVINKNIWDEFAKKENVKLSDLVGYETAKKKLVENTEAFVSGRKANNCLLYGDAGTGKSSSIKAIANEYYDRGLRIIEVYRHQFRDLNDVIAQIKNRNYRFIIYMDDLSFEDFETEYKYLKAVIEGGLEKKPDNVLIYATSNRRHLIREKFSDKRERDEDLHTNDTVQEKLSLVYRFGVTIYFGAPDKAQFQQIVKALAQRANISLPEEELLAEANKWELFHGGLSGRTAQQFIDYLSGTL